MSCEIQPARHNPQPTHQQGTEWTSNGQKCQIRAKGAGASEAGGQTKEGPLSKRYFQTSKIAQNRTKSPVPIVIDVFGVTAPYGNPYGSKIAIVWLFFVIFWPFWSHFQLLWSRLCIKLAPSAPKPSSHIGPLMRQPFLPDPGAYPGIQGPKNGYFLAKSGPNGPGRLQARPVHLERAWCAISHPNWWESIAWGHIRQFQAPIQASRAPKMAIFGQIRTKWIGGAPG